MNKVGFVMNCCVGEQLVHLGGLHPWAASAAEALPGDPHFAGKVILALCSWLTVPNAPSLTTQKRTWTTWQISTCFFKAVLFLDYRCQDVYKISRLITFDRFFASKRLESKWMGNKNQTPSSVYSEFNKPWECCAFLPVHSYSIMWLWNKRVLDPVGRKWENELSALQLADLPAPSVLTQTLSSLFFLPQLSGPESLSMSL